jgi:hypothetical protein
MKKLLIIALLFWGCEDAPTEHTHDDGNDKIEICAIVANYEHHTYTNIFRCIENVSFDFCEVLADNDNTCSISNCWDLFYSGSNYESCDAFCISDDVHRGEDATYVPTSELLCQDHLFDGNP